MAYLNQSEREKLLEELSKMDFNKAKGKLRRMDPQGRLAMFRNVQSTGEWYTRYDLQGLGVRVTLIENREGFTGDPNTRNKEKYDMVRVIVEPTPDNRT